MMIPTPLCGGGSGWGAIPVVLNHGRPLSTLTPL